MPSLTSRATGSSSASATKSTAKLSSAQKDRLRRIARRNVIGADGEGLGSADIKMTPTAESLRDAWDASLEPAPPALKGDFGVEGVVRVKPQAPITLQRQRAIRERQIKDGQGVEVPVGGVSYNPTQEAHEALLKTAVDEELASSPRRSERPRRLRCLRRRRWRRVVCRLCPEGSTSTACLSVLGSRPIPGRTRRRTGGCACQKADEAEDAGAAEQGRAADRQGAGGGARATSRQVAQVGRVRAGAQAPRRGPTQEAGRGRRATQAAQSREGTAGTRRRREDRKAQGSEGQRRRSARRGSRRDPSPAQGEWHHFTGGRCLADVSQPEGNLFKDRYLALQKKQLVEPRVKQLYVPTTWICLVSVLISYRPKRRVRKTKEYEKHAWKRFQ